MQKEKKKPRAMDFVTIKLYIYKIKHILSSKKEND